MKHLFRFAAVIWALLSRQAYARWAHMGLTNTLVRSLAVSGTSLFLAKHGFRLERRTDKKVPVQPISTIDRRSIWTMAAAIVLGLLLFCAGSTFSQIRIMPLGDSITRGVHGSSDSTGYRRALYQSLTGAGHSVDFVGSQTDGTPTDFDRNHEGHSGWRADQIRDNISSWLTTNPADIILLHIGTNDISQHQADFGVGGTIHEVRQILDRIDAKSTATVVFLARIINRNDGYSATTTTYNRQLQDSADKWITKGDLITVVDQESALSYPADLADAVHPNDVGYGKMAQCWFTALASYLPFAMVNTKVWLEGAFSDGSMSTALRTAGSIPLTQPYNTAPWNYTGSENVTSIPVDVVDWVLVELRTGTAASTKAATRAAFLKSNGSIVDLNGSSAVSFSSRAAGEYYIVVRQRNHLAVMSTSVVALNPSSTLYDFTTGSSQYYGGLNAAKDLGSSVWGMIAGDVDVNGGIGASDLVSVLAAVGSLAYDINDVDMNGGVGASDLILCLSNVGQMSRVP
jgi:lysophospholipase L1-like esterase